MALLSPRIEVVRPVLAELTGWFDATTTEPGQPGVFEVNPILVTSTDYVYRYAYWDGKQWGEARLTPAEAYDMRFCRGNIMPITGFRGLAQEA